MAYVWEDGIHVDIQKPLEVEHVKLDQPGLKILNVHPMLIYLNAPNDQLRRDLTRGIADLTSVPESHFAEFAYRGYGLKSFYRDLLAELKQRGVRTLMAKDVAALKSAGA
ncbi:hypothetical protein D3C72_1847240 [compost metagenome]